MSETWRMKTQFTAPSIPSSERRIMERVVEMVQPYARGEQLERLKTAVAEGALNAIEHGNQNRPELQVVIELAVSDEIIQIRITDQGAGQVIPEATQPNLEAKLAGHETPRGWGLFLIRNMVDEMRMESAPTHHTLELRFYRERFENEQSSS